MRVSTVVFAAAATLMLCLSSTAQAGLLELSRDNITRNYNCDITPCRDNNLAYKRVFVRDHYLRYDIRTRPAHYAMRRVRVMIAPPAIVAGRGQHRLWDFESRDGLVALPTGPYRVVAPARYTWVTRPVLVTPERNYVSRRHPHYAYYPEDIVVYSGN